MRQKKGDTFLFFLMSAAFPLFCVLSPFSRIRAPLPIELYVAHRLLSKNPLKAVGFARDSLGLSFFVHPASEKPQKQSERGKEVSRNIFIY